MIQDNIRSLQEEIGRTCVALQKNPYNIITVLVTKTVPVACIQEAYDAGTRHFGENKVQEFLAKYEYLPRDIEWHFVGHVQTNKVKYIVDKVTLIHSVDSLKLAQEIERQARKHKKRVNVLLQVNTSHEDTKSGVSMDECEILVNGIQTLLHVVVKGLMTIGPFTDDGSRIRSSFRSLKMLRDALQKKYHDIDFCYLSMGMSADYHIALEEDANILRIGSAIFGKRDQGIG